MWRDRERDLQPRSHDPIGRDPVLASGEDSDGGQQLLIGHVNILVDDGSIKEVSIKLFYPCRLFSTPYIVILLSKWKIEA